VIFVRGLGRFVICHERRSSLAAKCPESHREIRCGGLRVDAISADVMSGKLQSVLVRCIAEMASISTCDI
jgi:hypothetical protein